MTDRNDGRAFMSTGPRRFGRYLNLGMTYTFFSPEHKGNAWFDGCRNASYFETV